MNNIKPIQEDSLTTTKRIYFGTLTLVFIMLGILFITSLLSNTTSNNRFDHGSNIELPHSKLHFANSSRY